MLLYVVNVLHGNIHIERFPLNTDICLNTGFHYRTNNLFRLLTSHLTKYDELKPGQAKFTHKAAKECWLLSYRILPNWKDRVYRRLQFL